MGKGELSKGYVFACIVLADYDAVNALFKLADCAAQTYNCHNFRSNCN